MSAVAPGAAVAAPVLAPAPAGSAAAQPRTVSVALLGCGTVGAGVLEVLERNRADIERKAGRGIAVRRVLVRDVHKPRPPAVPVHLLSASPDDVVGDPAVDVVIEVMGGTGRARDLVLQALRSGRTVVTANKDLMAEYGREVWAAAEEGGADVYFEAAVGGGIPIVRALKESLAGNGVRRVAGILNGTTNYILTRMTRDGSTLEEALAEAQAAGYAEADPGADLDGIDAARKLCILSSIAYRSRCRPADVHVEGIRGIAPADVAHAARMGWTIKLLAMSELRDGRVGMRVHPTLVPRSHPLAAVQDAFNAVYVQADAVGEAMFYGRGAGALPTASSILGDLIEAVRLHGTGVRDTFCTCFHQRPFEGIGAVVSRYYVRLLVPDRAGVLARIAGVFGRSGVSILSVLQGPSVVGDEGSLAELVIVTHDVADERMRRAIAGLRRLEAVAGVEAVLRLAPEDL